MNILFVGKTSFDESSGVEKKLNGEIAAFERLGNKVWYTVFDEKGAWLVKKDVKISLFSKKNRGIVKKYLANERALECAVKYSGVSFQLCYIRKAMCSPIHLRNLRMMKKRGIHIVEEIPTFPYDDEFKLAGDMVSGIWLTTDRLFRGRLKRYLDAVTTFDASDEIFGIKTIKIQNGIQAASVPLHQMRPVGDTLHVISVSTTAMWHGVDRFIVGLSEYLKKNHQVNIVLHVVGQGPATESLIKLVGNLGVSENVIFHGALFGEELDRVFSICTTALSSLALHRKNVLTSSELKSREYMARGIPFICAARDEALAQAGEFILQLPGGDAPVDMQEVLRFSKSISLDESIPAKMREFAIKHLSWDAQMKKVLLFLDRQADPM